MRRETEPEGDIILNTDLESRGGHDGSVDDAAVGVDGVEDEEDVDEGEGDHGGAERHQLHVEPGHRGVELAPVVEVHDEVAGRPLRVERRLLGPAGLDVGAGWGCQVGFVYFSLFTFLCLLLLFVLFTCGEHGAEEGGGHEVVVVLRHEGHVDLAVHQGRQRGMYLPMMYWKKSRPRRR